MLKQLLIGIAMSFMSIGFAFAQVDVNKADQAALDGIKGLGPKTSKAILDERKKGGEFKNWSDFQNRVKGIGDKSSTRLSLAGLTVNGQAKPIIPAASKAEKQESLSAAKEGSKVAKAEAKELKKETKSIPNAMENGLKKEAQKK